MRCIKFFLATASLFLNSGGQDQQQWGIGKKLQDFGHRAAAIEIYDCLTVDCGLLTPSKFGEIFIFSGGTDIESTLHHLTLLQNAKSISQIANVHAW